MGKIKRQRRKLHPSVVKDADKDAVNEMDTGLLQPSVLFPTKGLLQSSNTEDASLPLQTEDDRMSFVSKKSIKGSKQITKVEKRKLRHDKWLEKVDTISSAKRRAMDAKKRAGVPVVGDMNPLNEALPELSEILRIGPHYTPNSSNTRNSQPAKKPRATLKMKDKQKMMLEESARFQEVLKHSAFKKNPFATINVHLKNKLKQEQQAQET
ncbi:protein FAM207A [Strongylocentrotus purpuratus]|uniref:Ribosome biogenesis protein SLX9 n=1 Tax=Strongylocentrotus purpuratus TaxID=7668 RepID=A0A7M7ST71_STRPU|nr:protein FAM207A [Strongylocentrotus purpuratus]|eukprot:XP_003728534.1 PREDICTED: protein FAM207A [Strongylocentrotus purpuratus]